MFIREQMAQFRELSTPFLYEDSHGGVMGMLRWHLDEELDRHYWSPAACRHMCWTFKSNPYGKRLWG